MLSRLFSIGANRGSRADGPGGGEESKQDAELRFWRNEIDRYVEWYEGRLSPLYNTPSPGPSEQVRVRDLKHAAVLTWHRLHQERKYLEDLRLDSSAFDGMRLLDVGAGPMPSATCFRGAQVYCLEPLLPRYVEAGFPLHYYQNATFVHGPSERIPVDDAFFDAVISVNAIDHVDDLPATALEVRRVLKPGGRLRMHVHYHPPTRCEPIEIDDEIFGALFGWCPKLRKASSSKASHSTELGTTESFALWSNF